MLNFMRPDVTTKNFDQHVISVPLEDFFIVSTQGEDP